MSFDVGDIVVCNVDGRVHVIVDSGTDVESCAVFYLDDLDYGVRAEYLKEAAPIQLCEWACGMQNRIATVISDLRKYGQTHHKQVSSFPIDREDRRDWVAIAHRKEVALTKELHALENETETLEK